MEAGRHPAPPGFPLPAQQPGGFTWAELASWWVAPVSRLSGIPSFCCLIPSVSRAAASSTEYNIYLSPAAPLVYLKEKRKSLLSPNIPLHRKLTDRPACARFSHGRSPGPSRGDSTIGKNWVTHPNPNTLVSICFIASFRKKVKLLARWPKLIAIRIHFRKHVSLKNDFGVGGDIPALFMVYGLGHFWGVCCVGGTLCPWGALRWTGLRCGPDSSHTRVFPSLYPVALWQVWLRMEHNWFWTYLSDISF